MVLVCKSVFRVSPNPDLLHLLVSQPVFHCARVTAISLAISRDGSSGGVIRTCTINENGMEKKYTPGDQLPQFWDQ